jgi:NAD-dependent deacetylase
MYNCKNTRSIVVLTGAGISAESGIQTFRAADGLWENHRVEDVASPEGFANDPELVHRFYNARRQQLLAPSMKPNAGHQAVADLEKNFKGEFLLVTQNIDDLHERAGSENIIHMHGELLQMRCIYSDKVFEVREDISVESCCSCCNKPRRLRPNIVWFGEMPKQMDRIFAALAQCDLFLSIGTSGNVYPAAGFVQVAAEVGAHTVEINLEPSTLQSQFDQHIYGRAGEQLPNFVERFFE